MQAVGITEVQVHLVREHGEEFPPDVAAFLEHLAAGGPEPGAKQ